MLIKKIYNEEQQNIQVNAQGLSILLREPVKKDLFVISLLQSIFIHIIICLIVLVVMEFLGIILRFLGFDINLFARPELKNRDIEFVLVNAEKYISQNSRFKLNAGMASTLVGPNPNNRMYDENAGLKGDNEDRIKNKAEVVNRTSKNDTNKAAIQANVPFSSKNKKGSVVPKTKKPDIFSITSPDIDKISNDIGFGANGEKGYSAASAGKVAIVSDGSGAKGSKTGGDTVGSGNSNGGGGYYYGNAGAPKAGVANKYDNDGLDIDLGPYVATVQRKIMRNWVMPNDNANKKTVLFLRISKSGNLMILNVKTPSGDTVNDNAAINAVKVSQPFPALPTGYKASYADIILTFDYNVSARKY